MLSINNKIKLIVLICLFLNYFYNILSSGYHYDPQRLFTYGYFDFEYQKYGVRSQIEFRATPTLGFRIYNRFIFYNLY